MAPCGVPVLLALEVAFARRRPKVPAEVRRLIRWMSLENSLWGARVYMASLLKPGIEVAQ
jgi:hypothetical protein